ncbi:hypothetical protein [Polaribacter gangjinensis]|uniref:Uncharacterized protein n=1 Tax=Polaribacter gangjinensis TaxID=574710 RepID=A0A2S7WE42_9FLAO|nr:hypothetical protein [Polaribacter gangjinensis]PQJ75541.1 hypothetical protein BTO13_10000 [Polaribacter gangjinensis]
MKPLKNIALIAVLLVGIFSFSKSENSQSKLNIDNLNVLEILSKQDVSCRPNSDFLFYVESSLVKKSRGFNTVNARVYMIDRSTGQYNLLASENVAIPFHKDMIALDYDSTKTELELVTLVNGDKIVGNDNSGNYSFSELMEYEMVYNSYINSTNKLLNLDRSI